MYTNVHCSTVYNSKDLESTQMPIDDRLDWENVTHIQHGILCSNEKWWVRVVCRDIDESGEHHSQQTATRTENETPHILTHRRVMKNENTWTQRGEYLTLGSIGGKGEGQWEREVGRDCLGRNTKCGWWGENKQNTLPCVYLCNCIACSAHVPQNLKCNKKKISEAWWRMPIVPATREAEAE